MAKIKAKPPKAGKPYSVVLDRDTAEAMERLMKTNRAESRNSLTCRGIRALDQMECDE